MVAVERIALAPHPVSLRPEVTAIELEAGSGELLARALEVCGAALIACGVERSRVGRVIVAGGAARLPFVRAALANYFERDIEAPVPDELVVAGAARRGASVIRFAS